MRTFRFSLEQVLAYRKQLEDQALLLFGQAVQARDKRLREKMECDAAIEDTRKKLSRAAGLQADERWLLTAYLTGLDHDRKRALADLIKLENDVDRCRSELIQKSQDRKLLEKLKEKQANRHMMTENHKEQQNYDDIATIRFTPSSF